MLVLTFTLTVMRTIYSVTLNDTQSLSPRSHSYYYPNCSIVFSLFKAFIVNFRNDFFKTVHNNIKALRRFLMDQTTGIRSQVRAHLGKAVPIVADRGRKRKAHYSGILQGAYTNVFTISCDLYGKKQSLTYSYNDIITGNVTFVRQKKQSGA